MHTDAMRLVHSAFDPPLHLADPERLFAHLRGITTEKLVMYEPKTCVTQGVNTTTREIRSSSDSLLRRVSSRLGMRRSRDDIGSIYTQQQDTAETIELQLDRELPLREDLQGQYPRTLNRLLIRVTARYDNDRIEEEWTCRHYMGVRVFTSEEYHRQLFPARVFLKPGIAFEERPER